MSVVVRSLVNYSQTLDSVALGPWAVQTRAKSTAALVAAVAAKPIPMDEVDSADVTIQYEAPLTGATVAINDSTESLIVDPAGTIAALTVTMPANPYDGQYVEVATTQTVTALTQTAAGKTIKGALTAGSANGFGAWRYSKATTTWYRVG